HKFAPKLEKRWGRQRLNEGISHLLRCRVVSKVDDKQVVAKNHRQCWTRLSQLSKKILNPLDLGDDVEGIEDAESGGGLLIIQIARPIRIRKNRKS
ncbi:hypothetical protein PIB30_045639, partial [Stylosanthes scabra]|nr:hypothetical protein [Stylosanthes scabra]